MEIDTVAKSREFCLCIDKAKGFRYLMTHGKVAEKRLNCLLYWTCLREARYMLTQLLPYGREYRETLSAYITTIRIYECDRGEDSSQLKTSCGALDMMATMLKNLF
jgi:hypothetical protein